KDKSKVAEELWEKLEENTENILKEHAPEVHAVAKALLEKGDLTGRQCIEIIRAAAGEVAPLDSEKMLKALVEETIISRNGKNGHENGKSEKSKTKSKSKAKEKETIEAELDWE